MTDGRNGRVAARPWGGAIIGPVAVAMATGLSLLAGAAPAPAGEADVLAARPRQEAGGTWRFDVTVRHADEGWAHYADRYEILAPDGRILATRVLLHPHVEEQPFTRSLSGVRIPAGVKRVRIRAHDKVHGYGGRVLTIELRGAGN